AITFASFWLILFLGRRLPKGGSEIGVLAVGATLVLSSIALFQWNDRDKTLEVTHGPAHAEEGADEGHEGDEGDEEHAAASPSVRLVADPAVSDHAAAGDAATEEGEHEAELIRSPVERSWTWFEMG